MGSILINTGFKKINRGFTLVTFIALMHAIASYFIIKNNNDLVVRMTKEINPYVEVLEKFNNVVTESKMYTTNWVYLQVRTDDKEKLRNIQQKLFPALNKSIDSLLQNSSIIRKGEKDTLRSLLFIYENLISKQKLIMKQLASFEDYENPTQKFEAEEIIESAILPFSDTIQFSLQKIIQGNRQLSETLKNEVVASSNNLIYTVVGFSAGLVFIIILASIFMANTIRLPVVKMKEIILNMAKGEPPNEILNTADDVIGKMAESVNKLSINYTQTANFANEIRSGNFSANFELLGENDELGKALLNMRNSLKMYSEEMEHKVKERTREVSEKNAKLEEAYKEIRDSIAYAKRIQEAILPSQELVRNHFKDSFIYYKPKDIVSGDFYWFADMGDEILFAVVDCTGHGVPGALMTVIGHSLLNQIVNISNERSPAKILTELDRRVIETLKQYGSGSPSNDGMDIALFRYHTITKQLTFSGAKRSLILFRNNKYQELKASKFPIGSTQYGSEKKFTEESLAIQPNDTIYLFTDGYQDQFGGLHGKKFMSKRFRELLQDVSGKKMQEQESVLEKENIKWTGDAEQTDDILVAGIRFN